MHTKLSIACAVTLLAATGSAQGTYGPTGGQQLFSLGGSISQMSIDTGGGDFEMTSFNAQAGFGYFLTDVHEVGAFLGESYSKIDAPGGNDPDDSISTDIGGYYNYNFRTTPRTWFYGGAHLGLYIADQAGQTDTNIAYGIHGGVRHWLNESAAVFAEPRITRSELDGDTVTTNEIIFGYSVVL
ncbi:MAG: outer membrane beta-barrel protein [Planctomycetes bacterium]|nr:outer membrane beta-barrel protein [Planctomycetota bacterium]